MKKSLWIIFTVLVSANSFCKERSSIEKTVSRERLLMDFDWRFFKGDTPGAEKADFNDGDWRKLD